jgi:hypothetical protein
MNTPKSNRQRLAQMRAAPRREVGRASREREYCVNGHRFDAENTRIDVKGKRTCRACDREKKRERRAREKQLRVDGEIYAV